MQQYEAHHPTEAFHIMLGKLYHKANDTARAIDHFRSAQRYDLPLTLTRSASSY